MAEFEKFKPRSPEESQMGSANMPDVPTEARIALENLSDDQRRRIGPDAAAVIRTALQLRTGDGLIDDTIKRAFETHGIDRRGPEEQRAYRFLLTAMFTFGPEAKERYEARRRDLSA